METGFVIWKYSHHYVVVTSNRSGILLARMLARRYVTYKLARDGGRFVNKPDKTYAAANESQTQYRFHINTFNEFRKLCKDNGIREEVFDAAVETVPMYPRSLCTPKFRQGWVDKPEQAPIIQWGIDNVAAGGNTLAFIWQTGYGKSYIGSRCAIENGGRLVMLLQPAYHEKWVKDFVKMMDLEEKDIYQVRGSGKLLDLTRQDWSHNHYPIVIISIDTYNDWIALYAAGDYKSMEEKGWGVDPPNLFEFLGAGCLMRDEVHERFHQMFSTDLYTHVPVTVNLTATLIGSTHDVTRMHEVMFPEHTRNVQKDIEVYTELILAKFCLDGGYNIRTTERNSTMHSQAAIEKSLLRNKTQLNAYCDFVIDMIEEHYVNKRDEGQRVIVFCAFRLFIDHVHREVQKAFPHLNVKKYKSGEDYNNLVGVDISITTKKSAGTAVDVPGLITVIDAHIQKSAPAVIQAFGRLRKLKDKTPRYVPLVCTDWTKHREYAENLRVTLRGRLSKISAIEYGMARTRTNKRVR